MGKQPTYQELLAAYNKLLMENECLHKEVDRLQSLLSSKSVPSASSTIKQHLSLEEKVDVFRNIFKGCEDAFARRWYSRTSENRIIDRKEAQNNLKYSNIAKFKQALRH